MYGSFNISITSAGLALAAQRFGLDTGSSTGQLPEYKGVILGYSLSWTPPDNASAVVTFTILKKPWMATSRYVQDQTEQALLKAGVV